jgi:Kef-type K+ transport system membrane component KefB
VLLLIGRQGDRGAVHHPPARTPLAASLRTAAQLAQAGEFGLVLIELAHQLQLISTSAFQITLSAMLLSMFIAPFLIDRAARLSGDLGRGDWAHKATVIHDIAVHSMDLGRARGDLRLRPHRPAHRRIPDHRKDSLHRPRRRSATHRRSAAPRASTSSSAMPTGAKSCRRPALPARAPWSSPIPTPTRPNG